MSFKLCQLTINRRFLHLQKLWYTSWGGGKNFMKNCWN